MRTRWILASVLVLTSACDRDDGADEAKEVAMVEPATARPPAGMQEPGHHPGIRPSERDAETDDPPGLLPKPPPELLTPERVRPDARPSLTSERLTDERGTRGEAAEEEGRRRERADDEEAAAKQEKAEKKATVAKKETAEGRDERRPVAGEARDDTLDVRGDVTQGGLVVVRVPEGTKNATLGDRRLRLSDEGTVLVAFAHDAPKRQTLQMTNGSGEHVRHVFEVEQRDFDETTIVGLPDEEVLPTDPEVRRELVRAQRRIAEARGHDTDEAFYREGFSWPAKGRLTSTYGVMRDFDGELQSRHWGVDIAVPVGTAVKAPAAGIVRFAEADVPLSGGLVIIDHGHGLSSSLLHLSEIVVAEGEKVKKGQVVARSGDTGRTTGPHLDWRMNSFDVRIDPLTVLKLRWR